MRHNKVFHLVKMYFDLYNDNISFSNVKEYLHNAEVIELCKKCNETIMDSGSGCCSACRGHYKYILMFLDVLTSIDWITMKFNGEIIEEI